ncbi:MAG: L,D-transpeptidase family protein [Gaiellales bacterium]
MKRTLLLFMIAAVVAVPLARADDPADSGAVETEPPVTTQPGDTPTDPPSELVPDGVTIDGLPVGGLTADQAREMVEVAFAQPLQFVWGGTRWTADPVKLGARARVDSALARALVAPPGSEVDLVVSVNGTTVRGYVDKLIKRFDRAPRNATVRLRHLQPVISEARPGVEVKKLPMVAAIIGSLGRGERGPLELVARIVPAKVTARNFGPIIVIRRGSRALTLYRGEKVWRKFGVAVGAPSYPTPVGRFQIVTMQRNPWWYPPPSPWAKDAKPVPPGPGNPLGTRWMGLSAPLVGIHGTPDSASIGYSASHGCIRMLIPQAEWLFDHVRVGTPVFIVPQ